MLKDKRNKDEVIEAHAASGKVRRKEFEKELAKLQVELTRLQAWVKDKGARIIVVFEGRDTAGKGGVISRITARTSPRIYRHVALPVPSDREKTQLFIQRYIAHFPAAGEIVLFDRSWYNRAGVERVMNFVTDEDYERFITMVPAVEREMIVNNGIILRKYFLDVSQDEQRRRFEARIKDPMRHWKLRLHRGLPAYDQGHRHAIGALVHRSRRQQASRPAKPDPASARQHPIQEGRRRLAEDSQGAAAAQERYRESGRRPADSQPLLIGALRFLPRRFDER
jgi:polyphosphate kinase 2